MAQRKPIEVQMINVFNQCLRTKQQFMNLHFAPWAILQTMAFLCVWYHPNGAVWASVLQLLCHVGWYESLQKVIRHDVDRTDSGSPSLGLQRLVWFIHAVVHVTSFSLWPTNHAWCNLWISVPCLMLLLEGMLGNNMDYNTMNILKALIVVTEIFQVADYAGWVESWWLLITLPNIVALQLVQTYRTFPLIDWVSVWFWILSATAASSGGMCCTGVLWLLCWRLMLDKVSVTDIWMWFAAAGWALAGYLHYATVGVFATFLLLEVRHR